MIVRPAPIAALLCLAASAPASAQEKAPDQALPLAKSKLPLPPPGPLKLVRVGGTLDGRVTQFFDESSVTLADGKASVWRLYVTGSARFIGRMMTQAVWTLSDYDCEGRTVTSRISVLLGNGLEVVAHGGSTVGSSLYGGEIADAITATEVCGGETVGGPRFASVSGAVRYARSGKDKD
jgi:hypothetical protein